jgi:tRNA threonylcarbamoyladenosine biosynthesis protein TsaE
MSIEDSTIQLASNSVEQTMAIAEAVAKAAKSGDMIGLVGELGAGKTQFVRGLAVGLGISPRLVSSPTFVFLQEYPVDEGDPVSLVLTHIDAYRLAGADDLQSIGWDGDGQELRHGAVLAVEWADRIEDALGADWLKVALEHTDAGRIITLWPHGVWRDRMHVLRQDLEHLTQHKEA